MYFATNKADFEGADAGCATHNVDGGLIIRFWRGCAPDRQGMRGAPFSARSRNAGRLPASAPSDPRYRVPPKPALKSSRWSTPPIASCARPRNPPVTSPSSPPVRARVLPSTRIE